MIFVDILQLDSSPSPSPPMTTESVNKKMILCYVLTVTNANNFINVARCTQANSLSQTVHLISLATVNERANRDHLSVIRMK